MRYHVRRQGQALGIFSPEELRRRRETGELSGNDYVRTGEASDWQPLDLVLAQGYRVTPPPLPSAVSTQRSQPVIWFIVIAGIVLSVVFFGFIFNQVWRGYASVRSAAESRTAVPARPEALTAARQPVLWTSNALTAVEVNKTAREFRVRQWIAGYEERGERHPESDAAVLQFFRTWLAGYYGGAEATNVAALGSMTVALAADARCTDALALAMIANITTNPAQIPARFDRARAAFPGSKHRAYPQFCVNVWLARNLEKNSSRLGALDAAALAQLQKSFADGSFTPADQPIVAEILINDWGYNFFYRNAAAVVKIANDAGADWQWLALVLDGEYRIIEAWRARGGGDAGTVTEDGWRQFRLHLAAARKSLTAAWNLQPDWPLAPCRMIYVSLGDSDIAEMREWFDRTTAAQVDYPRAWKDLRWGLRPRWYGSEESLLALGETAISSGRFDTDVPRKFIDCVYDVEAEMKLPKGEHIFGRADIWPQMQRLYAGYLAAPSQAELRSGWRSSYAVIASYAGKFDVARAQLEALDWKLQPNILAEWKLDAELWPLEIAARSGPLGEKISAAETLSKEGNPDAALKQYTDLNSNPAADGRTKEFILRRMAALKNGGAAQK